MSPVPAKAALLFLLAFFAAEFFPVPAPAAEYVYDQAKSRVGFTLRNLGIVTVEGHFKTFSGSFSFDPQKVENSRVMIMIRAASVDSGSPLRDEHLRSEKFFDAKNNPEIRFTGKKFEKVATKHFRTQGDLSIHGITKPAVFETELLNEPADITGKERIFFRAYTLIKRKDFHLGTGNWMDPILLLTDETLKISLEIEGLPIP